MTVTDDRPAHTRILGVDLPAALAAPGVVAAYSGADLTGLWAAPMPCAWPVTADMNPPHYPVAVGKVAYVGDAVAVVLATSEVGHTIIPSPANQLGVKGIGEAGTIGAAPAVINSIVDALSGLGVNDVLMPASPQTVGQTIQAAIPKTPSNGDSK